MSFGLRSDGIYAILSAIGKQGDWQWALYYPATTESGCLLRVKPHRRTFIFSPKDYDMPDPAAVAIVRIGTKTSGLQVEHLIDALANVPIHTGDVYRTWFLNAVVRLHAMRYLSCPNVPALEQELTAMGYLGEDYRRRRVAMCCERTSTKCW